VWVGGHLVLAPSVLLSAPRERRAATAAHARLHLIADSTTTPFHDSPGTSAPSPPSPPRSPPSATDDRPPATGDPRRSDAAA
jgi:hypothetical protein